MKSNIPAQKGGKFIIIYIVITPVLVANLYNMGVQAAGLAPEDPTGGYMLQAGARLCKCLGEEFLPYLSVVMPPLLHSAQLRPDVNISRADADSDGDDDEEEDDEVMPFLVLEVSEALHNKPLVSEALFCRWGGNVHLGRRRCFPTWSCVPLMRYVGWSGSSVS